MDTLVQLENVTKRYDGAAVAAVDDVSMRIDAGEAVAIMGPSGSGKSTLLNLIAAMDRPTSGAVRVGDERVDVLGEAGAARFRRKQVGMIFQFFNLLDDMTVIDNVLLPAQLAGARARDARQRADQLLDTLRIGHRRDAYPARLSGGERQRVAIARALINRPSLLLADEPTGAVDSATGDEIGALLLELNAAGQTLVLVTHSPELAHRYARRVIHIADGRIASDTAVAGGARGWPASGRRCGGRTGDQVMSAVFRAARGGLGGRRLQAIIIGLVVLVATAASTLALGMLADAHSPFDHAFAAQRGADVAVTVDTSAVTAAQLTAATKVTGVTAVAGPFASASVTAQVTIPQIEGTISTPLNLVARSSPGGPVDDLTLQAGHWATSDSQVVLSASANAPSQLGATIKIGNQVLTVVGIANSVTNTADGWVLPAELTAIAGSAGTGQAQLLYRFADSGTTGDLNADIGAVKAALPGGAVIGTTPYLAVRQSEQSNVAPWVPFIIAFGVIALVISVLIVVNVVGGAVVAGTTRIGVLKSIGFTPFQVVACYVLLVAVPAVIGAVAGVVCGNLLATPIYAQNAQVYQVGVLGVPFWVDIAVPLTVLVLTVAAAVGPASRAGAMSAVQAIATGRAPRPRHGFLAQRALAKLTSVPRPVTLGFATPAARPGRTLVTVVAILFGAAAVTFGVGLATSLNRVYADISDGARLPVRVMAAPALVPANQGGPGLGPAGPARPASGKKHRILAVVGPGAQPLTAAQQHAIVTAIDAQPGTLHYLTEADDNLEFPGLTNANGGGAQITAYGDGDPAWSNLQLITGTWYAQSAAAQVDVNTLFLTDTSLAVGDTYTMVNGAHQVTAKIVGEVFAPGNDVEMFMSPATLIAVDPTAGGIGQYAISLKPGVSPITYASSLGTALGTAYGVGTGGGGTALIAITTLVAMLTLLIIAVAGLGVLNTVALQIRERARDIGIFKALGMTPRQTLTMVVCSVAVTGLVAGIIAVPAGIALHHGVLPAMAHAANSGLPESVISVFSLPELIILALAGLVIAVAGALAPATWAARSRTAAALRTE